MFPNPYGYDQVDESNKSNKTVSFKQIPCNRFAIITLFNDLLIYIRRDVSNPKRTWIAKRGFVEVVNALAPLAKTAAARAKLANFMVSLYYFI
jgi:hypothetical protein